MSRSEITFFCRGEPKGQPRPRAFARRIGGRYVARVFDAGTAENWKSLIAVAAKPHAPATPLVGPLVVTLTFYLPRPKSHYKGDGPARVLRPWAPYYQSSKPDSDNLAKAVLDALTQLGVFWKDDCQVAWLTVKKFYHHQPGCSVIVSQLEDASN